MIAFSRLVLVVLVVTVLVAGWDYLERRLP